MTWKQQFCVLLAALCLGQSIGWAASQPLELRWSELAPLIAGQRVELTLSQGGKIKGEAVTVREDALVMDVRKASDSNAYPRGSATVPRASISLIQLDRTRGSWGRGMGTVIGVLTGLVVGGYITARTADSAGSGIPLFLGLASGMSLAGYYAGKEVDRRITLIKIVP